MIIEMMKPSDLIPYKNNPRKNEDAIDKVATSISEFGFKQPIVVDKDNVIIVGHARFKAALKMGLKEVPVLKAIDLTPAQAKAYRIADNQTATFAEFDFELLEIELNELKELDVDMDWLEFDEFDDIDKMEDGDEIEVEQSVQLQPPKEYILIMCEPNSVEWEELKELFKLKMVRKGGYKKGSAFDDIGLERVLEYNEFKKRLKIVNSNTK